MDQTIEEIIKYVGTGEKTISLDILNEYADCYLTKYSYARKIDHLIKTGHLQSIRDIRGGRKQVMLTETGLCYLESLVHPAIKTQEVPGESIKTPMTTEKNTPANPTVFISYAWENEVKTWVKDLGRL